MVEGISLFIIPEVMKDGIIKEIHERGHFHLKKIMQIINKEFHIADAKQRIDKCISNCIKCILAERKAGKGERWLHPIPKGEVPLDTLHVDFLGPTGKSYKYILTIVDSFTKFTWIFPTKTMSADEAIQKMQMVVGLFGNPRQIISDKGGAFISTKFKHFCDERGVSLHLVTTGTPRGNGQVERVHQVIITSLTKRNHKSGINTCQGCRISSTAHITDPSRCRPSSS